MLISVSVLMTLAARDFTSSLNRASGHATGMTKDKGVSVHLSASSVNSYDVTAPFIPLRLFKRHLVINSSCPQISSTLRYRNGELPEGPRHSKQQQTEIHKLIKTIC